MFSFEKLFVEAGGISITYKDKTLVMSDRFPATNGERFKITFERTDSEWKQGIAVSLENGDILINDVKLKGKSGTVIWEHTAPRIVEFTVDIPKTGQADLILYNVCDFGDGVIERGTYGPAMYVEAIENGRRYHCNDGHPDDDLDDLIFCIERVPGSV